MTKTEETKLLIPDEDTDTEEEVARFVRPRPPREPSQVYSIRIPVDRLGQLRRLAEGRGLPPTVLLREWALERLTEELGGEPVPSQYEILTDRIIQLEQKLVEQEKSLADSVRQAIQSTVRTLLEDADLRSMLLEKDAGHRSPTK